MEKINGSQKLIEDLNVTQSLIRESNRAKPKLRIRKMIVQILKESQNNTLSLKKLKKKVFAKHILKIAFKQNFSHFQVIKKYKSMDDSLSKEEIASKFFSKLNKIKKIQINDYMVTLRD